jgi:hypothetical protein
MVMQQPPGLLDDEEFLSLQGVLGSGYDGLTRLQGSLDSGLEIVAFSTNVIVETDMLYAFEQNAELVNTTVSVDLMAQATLALIGHVENRSGQTLNDYLWTRALKVTPSFAELSSGLGHPVYSVNIA